MSSIWSRWRSRLSARRSRLREVVFRRGIGLAVGFHRAAQRQFHRRRLMFFFRFVGGGSRLRDRDFRLFQRLQAQVDPALLRLTLMTCAVTSSPTFTTSDGELT